MALDKKQVGKALNSIAYGQAMIAAARDYAKELEEQEHAAQHCSTGQDIDVDELLDDPELEALHRDRLAAMKQEAERRAQLQAAGHGSYTEVSEGDFLEVVTKSEAVVVHFYHKDFERCKILDAHLEGLAKKYLGPRFIKISAPDAPFFTVKLGIRVLPALVMFKGGVSVDRVVGFEPLGGKDDFSTAALEARLKAAGMVGGSSSSIKAGGRGRGAAAGCESEEEEEEAEVEERRRRAAAGGGVRRGIKQQQLGDGDESSDFDD